MVSHQTRRQAGSTTSPTRWRTRSSSPIKPYMRNRLDRDKEDYKHMEEVSFTYRKMTWNYEPGGIGAEADWREPPVSDLLW